MEAITLDPALLTHLTNKTAIVTGAAGGIGSEIIRLFASHNANVVVADLPHTKEAAESLIASLPDPSRGLFVPTNILDWEQMKTLFKTTVKRFGSVEVVVANAGIMEGRQALDADFVDEDGEPVEPTGAYRVIDINVKGTLNTLLAGLHYMKDNPPTSTDTSRGSIVLISSTSGYFGGTGVTGYVTSKHAVTGLLRSSQIEAKKHKIRVNAIAPFLTPSNMSSGFSQEYISRGLEANTPEGVARVVGTLAMDESRRGCCFLTCGRIIREMEYSLKANTGVWLGEDAAELMVKAAEFFEDIGGVENVGLRPDRTRAHVKTVHEALGMID